MTNFYVLMNESRVLVTKKKYKLISNQREFACGYNNNNKTSHNILISKHICVDNYPRSQCV